MKKILLYLGVFSLLFLFKQPLVAQNNYSMSFDGQNDYIDLGDLQHNGTSSFSFITYFKTDNPENNSRGMIL